MKKLHGTTVTEEGAGTKKPIGSEETSALEEANGLLEVTVSGFRGPVMLLMVFLLVEM